MDHYRTSQEGLSPRVRGNHDLGVGAVGFVGSIPARAGKPRLIGAGSIGKRVYPRACGETPSSEIATWPNWVYPRACGETRTALRGSLGSQGLSPRVRGNPRRLASWLSRTQVYPRVGGGTRS